MSGAVTRGGTSLRSLRADADRARDPDGADPADDRVPADAGGARRPDHGRARRAGLRRRSSSKRQEAAGLDKPLLEQYVEYLGDAFTLDLGTTINDDREVTSIIVENGARDARADPRRVHGRARGRDPDRPAGRALPRHAGSTSAGACSGSSSTRRRSSSPAFWPSCCSRASSAGCRARAARARSSSSSSTRSTHFYLIDTLIAGDLGRVLGRALAPDPAGRRRSGCWSAAC